MQVQLIHQNGDGRLGQDNNPYQIPGHIQKIKKAETSKHHKF